MLLLLQLQIVQKNVRGNSATATTASKCTGNSATATKLATARNIKLQGAVSGNTNFDGSENVVINTEIPVSEVTKELTHKEGEVKIKLKLRKQLNIVYANLEFTIRKNTQTSFAFGKIFPSGYEPKENLQINSSGKNTGDLFLKLYIQPTAISGLAINSSTENDEILIAQATYIVN